jgi:phosphatidylinositol-3-phosphatase
MKKSLIALAVAGAVCTTAHAGEGKVPHGIGRLDHVFVILMENHSYGQIVGNPDEPYLNGLISSGKVSVAKNYFGVGHPSLTNYLEIVGGSNFGVRSDNAPDWHNKTCQPNIETGVVNADGSANSFGYKTEATSICPIGGSGMDAATEAVDNWNEITPPDAAFLANIDGVKSYGAASTVGKTIADQLASDGKSWKSYQESLPFSGADYVTYSNGTITDLTFGSLPNIANLPAVPGGYVKAYAAKHNPFVYFQSVQEGGLDHVVGFDGAKGLYADLARGSVPTLSFIAPNQCNDQHGRGNVDSFCQYDPSSNGTQAGLNPGLIAQGDATLQRLVESIKASPAWTDGHNAIVIVWDENDYSGVANAPASGTTFPAANTNQVLLTVETNHGKQGASSNAYYNHFSLLRTLEAGFGLPCLNHACDPDAKVMSDLFGRGGE